MKSQLLIGLFPYRLFSPKREMLDPAEHRAIAGRAQANLIALQCYLGWR
jgi:hypothetical protein